MIRFRTLAPDLALAAILLAGASTLTAAPAIAKEKKEEAKAGPKFSPAFIAAANPLQTAINANDMAAAAPLFPAAEAAATTDDDKYMVGIFKYRFEMKKADTTQTSGGKIDQAALRTTIEQLVANPVTPADQRGQFYTTLGKLSFNDKDYKAAATYFDRARAAGQTTPEILELSANSKLASGDRAGGNADLEAAFAARTAAGQKPTEQLYRYAFGQSFKAGDVPKTTQWLEKFVVAYPTPTNFRDAIAIYGLQGKALVTLDKAQKLDLYRLLRAKGAMADQSDYELYAQWAVDLGLPHEAVAVLSEGKRTGKIPAGSQSATQMLAAANASIKGDSSLTQLETGAKAASTGLKAAQTGDAYLGSGNYAKAIELYGIALQKGGVKADEVNTHLGIAKAQSGDKAGAKAAFATVTTPPRAGIAHWWDASLDTTTAPAA